MSVLDAGERAPDGRGARALSFVTRPHAALRGPGGIG
jgi:hypothetical protein